MKQVIQNFKTGELGVADVPAPSLAPGFVLVRNHFSLISSGTERSTVSTAQASLLGKARQRPDLVKQVLDSVRSNGLAETLMRVRTKLDSLKELGYSSAGTVLASLDSAGTFKPGDRVACGGGGYASHAGVIAVPQNLVVKVPESVPLEAAAFATLGAIAMQGVRQANPRIGESVCVIGLGLLGQITGQILRANGCQVFGVDTSDAMVALAVSTSCHAARTRGDAALDSALTAFTGGHGFDAVIITAATQSADPIELSTRILRQKGVIVVVGAVPMNVPREPYFYKKELELKISCSYGPGRYDPSYEEGGQDYPYGHVRWTENRNMGAFIQLLQHGSVDVQPLTSHTFDVDDAERAYDIVTGKVKEPHIAILLRYPQTASAPLAPPATAAADGSVAPRGARPRIAFIGAGSFAQKFLIPVAAEGGDLEAVVTSRGVSAKGAADKFKFRQHTTDASSVLSGDLVNTVFVATRHDSHAGLATAALEAGKHVFVEKPLALNADELARVLATARAHPDQVLMVGYNRRFSPLARQAREIFGPIPEPVMIAYRVNAGFIPPDHWTQTSQGGGRILGETCHFIDFMQWVTDADPVEVHAQCLTGVDSTMPDRDNVAVTIKFDNGSVGQLLYLACGDKAVAKERIEVFGGGQTLLIDDFRSGEHCAKGRVRRLRLPGKGHREEVQAFLAAAAAGTGAPIPLRSLALTSATTLAIHDSLATGLPQAVSV